jgi:hypothetical protein
MAKNKRYIPKRSGPPRKVERSQQERCYLVAKKILRHYDLEPELIDVFTKKQKEMLLRICYDQPDVKAKKERTVPRQYVRNINNETYQIMKTQYWGEPENQLTYMELATYGLTFLGNLSDFYRKNAFIAGTPQAEAARRIFEKFNGDRILETAFKEVMDNIWYWTRCYSRVTYRMYGYEYDFGTRIRQRDGWCINKLTFLLTARESETKEFVHNGIRRKAYRLFMTADGLYVPGPATVARNDIYPEAKEDEKMNIYIQSHALQRFKERLDAVDPSNRNLLIQSSFTNALQVVTVGKNALFACLLDGERALGYFAFFVHENDIVVNTFLPLTGDNTPEGRKLHELLPLNREEIVHLGMDKISFLLTVDFEKIPLLKQAFTESNIWPTKIALDRMFEEDEYPVDMGKTMFVKNYLDRLKQRTSLLKEKIQDCME